MKSNEYLCLRCTYKYENITSLKIRKRIDHHVDVMRETLSNQEEFAKLSIDTRYKQIKQWLFHFNRLVQYTELVKNKNNDALDKEFWKGVEIWLNHLTTFKNHYKYSVKK